MAMTFQAATIGAIVVQRSRGRKRVYRPLRPSRAMRHGAPRRGAEISARARRPADRRERGWRGPGRARSSGSWRGRAGPGRRWIGAQSARAAASRIASASSTSSARGWKAATIGRICARMDAPHARVAELARGARRGRGATTADVAELGDDVVRRRLGVAVARGGDRQLGAHDQRMGELALGAHRLGRDRAAMRGDEVHQAERERLDARMGGDRLDLAQRAVGLDQRVQRERAAPAPAWHRRARAARSTSATLSTLGSIR